MNQGNNLTRPSIELKAAELFTSLIKDADMVKFTKNGSTAVTAAVKLARAYTGKKIILRCSEQPFFHMMIGLLDQQRYQGVSQMKQEN